MKGISIVLNVILLVILVFFLLCSHGSRISHSFSNLEEETSATFLNFNLGLNLWSRRITIFVILQLIYHSVLCLEGVLNPNMSWRPEELYDSSVKITKDKETIFNGCLILNLAKPENRFLSW